MANKAWYTDMLGKVMEIEKFRASRVDKTEQEKIDSKVARAMLKKQLIKSYKKVTVSHERVKRMVHIDKLHTLMTTEKNKVLKEN